MLVLLVGTVVIVFVILVVVVFVFLVVVIHEVSVRSAAGCAVIGELEPGGRFARRLWVGFFPEPHAHRLAPGEQAELRPRRERPPRQSRPPGPGLVLGPRQR